jgi:putative lipoic acid-binding regulatory protein
MEQTFDKVAFKEKLASSSTFPTRYLFKFIVPAGKEPQIAALFPGEEVLLKPSSGGKYISTTIHKWVDDADQILALYEKAATIEGLISL